MIDTSGTRHLVRLCAGYFTFYVITGVAVKYFQGPADQGFPGIDGLAFLLYNTAGGNLLCLVVVAIAGWWGAGGRPGGRELAVMSVSGLCTAVVIPATTLLYSLPISVMVAMVIMRGSVIVISRLVDAVQIRQGLVTRQVQPEENIAVGFALAAVGTHLVVADADNFDFLDNRAAVIILGSYVAAYAVRIYLMNWFKNTRGAPSAVRAAAGPATRKGGGISDNRAFFAWEQLFASIAIAIVVVVLLVAGPPGPVVDGLRGALRTPHPAWPGAMLAGGAFGVVAFFSVFIFLFKGRSATFAGLVNRLVSLVAGTVATLISAVVFGGKLPGLTDWVSLGFILVAVFFLTRAERRTIESARRAA